MLGALWRLLAYRFLGARIVLAITVFGWIRRLISGRRGSSSSNAPESSHENRPREAVGSAYQPSQGESQIVQREPR